MDAPTTPSPATPGIPARVLGWVLGLVWLLWAARQLVPTLADGAPAPPGPTIALAALALVAGVLGVFGRPRWGALAGALVLAVLGCRVAGVFGPSIAPVRAMVSLAPASAAGLLALLAGLHALALALSWPVRPRRSPPRQ